MNIDAFKSLQAKDIQHYISALKKGFELITTTGLLTNKSIIQIQEVLEDNKAGFRKLPGTALEIIISFIVRICSTIYSNILTQKLSL